MIPIQIAAVGGPGNTMFQYMFAKRLQAALPEAVIGNVHLPQFGIDLPRLEMPPSSLVVPPEHQVDVSEIAHMLRTRVYPGLRMRGYVQRLAYYLDRVEMAALFPAAQAVDTTAITPRSLVINVRGSEVLGDVHRDYGPVPVDYFEQIAQAAGLEPILVGQLGDDRYSDEIRRRFAGCTIIESVSPAADFELLRSATNLVIGVSTFSWLAAWLSPQVQQVFMPVSGIFNPAQRPDIDLLPLSDERYRFYGFPEVAWTAQEGQYDALVQRGSTFPELSITTLRQLRRDASEGLERKRRQADPSALRAALRQRDRLHRRLDHVAEAYDALRAERGLPPSE